MEQPRAVAPARDTGLPPGVAVGGLGRRFLAYLVDALVPAAASAVINALAGRSGTGPVVGIVVAALVALGWAVLCWAMLAQRAATPGMRLTRIQLVGFLDGRPVGWGRALLRYVVFALVSATGLGLLLLLVFLIVHPRHQGWHDLVANGVVIAERPLAPKGARPSRPQSVPAAAPAGQAGAPAPGAPPAAPARPREAAVSNGASRADVETRTAVQAPAVPTSRSILEGWVAELDDGRQVTIEGLVLLGRNPQPAAGEEDAQLIKLADESRTVSKTHLALGVDDAGLFVVDRGSTNGSTVTTPRGTAARCPAHTAVSVVEGSIVSIGDHWLRIRRNPG